MLAAARASRDDTKDDNFIRFGPGVPAAGVAGPLAGPGGYSMTTLTLCPPRIRLLLPILWAWF